MITSKFKNIKIGYYEFTIFMILFLISFSITFFQYSDFLVLYDIRPFAQAGLIFNIPYGPWSGIVSGDEPYYLVIASTILNHQSLYVEDFFLDTNPDPIMTFTPPFYNEEGYSLWHVTKGNDGHYYTNHGLGLSFLLLPGYYMGGIFGAMITMNIMYSLIGVIIFKLSYNLTSKQSSFITTIVFCIGTILLTFSGAIYSEVPATLLLIYSLYLFFFKRITFFNSLQIGSLFGFIIFLKLSYVIFPLLLIPIMGFLMLRKKNRKNFLVLILVFSLFLSLFITYNYITLGEVPKLGGHVGGIVLTYVSEQNSVENFDKLTKGLANYLFGQSYGMFVFSPLILLAIFGIPILWKQNRTLALTFILTFIVFLSIHSWGHPYAAGWTMPTRYILPLFPLMAIPLALLFNKYSKNLVFETFFLITSSIGIIFNIIFANIIRGHLYPLERAEIAAQVYYGTIKIFPLLNIHDPTAITNLWENTSYIFWIFLGIVISLLTIFSIIHHLQKPNRINKKPS